MLIRILMLCVLVWSITGSSLNARAQQQQQGSSGQAVERQTAIQSSVQQQPQASAQPDADTAAPRAALTEQAAAFDAQGRTLLQARLLTTELRATPDAPLRNVRMSISNPTRSAYTYVSGWVTFYDAQGVRSGEGLWTLNALAPGESAETDAPGLRLTNIPVAWRIAVLSSVGGTGNAAALLPAPTTTPQQSSSAPSSLPPTTLAEAATSTTPRLEININGERFTVQPGQTLDLEIGKERVRIVANTIP